MKCNTKLFKSNSYIISYRGRKLGKTSEAPILNFDPGLYAAQSSFTGSGKVRNIIATMSIKIIVKIKATDVNKNHIEVNEHTSENNMLSFSENILATGGELCFYPCRNKFAERKSICFPKTVLIPDKHCIYRAQDNKEKFFQLTFEAHENSQGILIQEYSI